MAEPIRYSQSGPGVGRSAFAQGGVTAINDSAEQRNLKATIARVNRVRAKYESVNEEGKAVGDRIEEKGKTMSSVGEERAAQLRSILEESVNVVQKNSSQDNSRRMALIEAVNKPGVVEAGKGTNLSSEA